jgi:chemotaxis protein MotB
VVRYLLGLDVAADRMTAAGYADQRPLYPPSDPRAVTMNRRVEVVVLSDQPAEVRALLEAAAEGK